MTDGTKLKSRPHELILHVRKEDIAELGHGNNVVYLCWIQDLATEHWLSVASPEQISETFGVVVRHQIDYERPAHLGDELIAA
jgi:acyl-CoA thioester hydrolase